jgi:lipopolysaccharide export system protein LptC
MRFLKVVLPAGVGLLLAYLLLSPLSKEKEISFLLDKNKVDGPRAAEDSGGRISRLDDEGRAFSIDAGPSGAGEIERPGRRHRRNGGAHPARRGPATITADRAATIWTAEGRRARARSCSPPPTATGSRPATSPSTSTAISRQRRRSRGQDAARPLHRRAHDRRSASAAGVLTGRARLHIEQGGLR